MKKKENKIKREKKPRSLKVGKHIQAQHFQNILNDSPDGLVIFDKEGTILEWNKGATEIFGYAREEVIGTKFDFLIPSDLKKANEISLIMRTIDEHGYLKNHLTERLRKDGKRITVEISRAPIKDKNGKIISYTAVVRDKSENIELNKRLMRAEKLAAVGQLVSGFAHEIGTPLNVIVGNSELILSELEPGSPHKIYLEKIIATAMRVTTLIKRMLQFSSPKSSAVDKIDINELLDELYTFLRKQLEKNDIKVQLNFAKKLPYFYGDRGNVEEVFINIMINAWHAMNKGGKLSIKTSVIKEKEKPYINIRFRDTGVGIPEEILPRIFEPFFTTKDPQKGTGLGLYVAHTIVEKYGGFIRISSKVNKGTIIHVLLPISEDKNEISKSG